VAVHVHSLLMCGIGAWRDADPHLRTEPHLREQICRAATLWR
jgi:hypothetical protein